jgi:hypothetical protein
MGRPAHREVVRPVLPQARLVPLVIVVPVVPVDPVDQVDPVVVVVVVLVTVVTEDRPETVDRVRPAEIVMIEIGRRARR